MERLAAAARCFGIGIGNLKARLHQAINVVDLRPGEIQRALHINEDLDPVAREHLVVRVLLFLKAHLILQTGAATTHDTHAQRVLGLHLRWSEFPNLGCCRFRNRDHPYPPNVPSFLEGPTQLIFQAKRKCCPVARDPALAKDNIMCCYYTIHTGEIQLAPGGGTPQRPSAEECSTSG